MLGVDVTGDGTWRALPTATGLPVNHAIAALRTHGVAIAPLLKRAGLAEGDLDKQQRRVSAAAQSKFLEYAAEALDDGALGLHLAEQANPREAGLMFYVASAASSLGDALELFARYFSP